MAGVLLRRQRREDAETQGEEAGVDCKAKDGWQAASRRWKGQGRLLLP